MVKKEKIKANWQPFERRPTWSVLSSAELAQALNVHLQTINNWKIRGILPSPISHSKLTGNKNYFIISSIRSWLESKPESEIHWDWIKINIPYDIETLNQAEYVVKNAYHLLNVEKPLIPALF